MGCFYDYGIGNRYLICENYYGPGDKVTAGTFPVPGDRVRKAIHGMKINVLKRTNIKELSTMQ